ncbi:MAG: glycine zipper 2TM domain-containing protein [Henriciella sp.]|uniref:glycine zipper 2TM domain-containing protein n=1 Tax=Henriciella sp. TaxID=1968823 RepID=UPI00261FA8DE|nr:glycine zipper 2TM domain-containing protein [Henriciella sp.]
MTTETATVKTPSRMMAGAFAALTLALAGCASGYGANTVSSSSVGYASTVREGTVTSVREVVIRPDNSVIGVATGAILGGLAGSELGGGDKAQTAGAVGGAVLGGIAGNEVGKGVNTKRGFAYTVRFNDGNVKEIVQGNDIYIQPGTRVNVTFREDRVTVAPAGY